ncbi:MAG: oligosaccharide flippase family protein [Chitinophagales bacterium]|jgi:O-antigen/teichoic acid export membrane protein|nr:oligosaccharide flippase family protein [Chitinophagales bacterium]
MNQIKRFLSQTFIYGASTILVRMLSWLLTPYYTRKLAQIALLGIVTDVFVFIGIMNVLYSFGMETTFFRFQREENYSKNEYLGFQLVFWIAIIFSSLIWIFSPVLSEVLQYQDTNYLKLAAIILFLDNVALIPLAKLRQEGKSMRFMSIRLVNVVLNVVLNLIFLEFYQHYTFTLFGLIIQDAVSYILLANVLSSLMQLTLVNLWPYFRHLGHFDWSWWTSVSRYSLPIVIMGFAGMINELIDRTLLKYLLPKENQENFIAIGIYSANYKLSIFMTLIIQGFKLGAEPFFFKQAEDKNGPKTFSLIMELFILFTLPIFVFVSIFIDQIALIIHHSYYSGRIVVPILLLANLFLGIYYNTSIWFKNNDKTHFAMIISLIGALITLTINFIFIPKFSYIASAYATLACYFSMTLISFLWGRRYMPIPYRYLLYILFIVVSIFVVYIANISESLIFKILISISYLSIWVIWLWTQRHQYTNWLKTS